MKKLRHGFVVVGVLLAPGPVSADACFTAADKAPFPVYQQAPPPRTDGQAGYVHYPVSVAATVQIDRLRASTSSVQGAYWQWANHGPRALDQGAKGNITPGSPGVQIRFSSRRAADHCTLAQTAAVLGADPAPYIAAGGLQQTTAAQMSDTRDLCILQASTLPERDPVILDYEVQDDRSAAQTLDFLTTWAALVHAHGRAAILYPNALDGISQAQTHLTPVAAKVATLFDKVHVMMWSRNTPGDIAESFAFQVRAYATTPAKLLIAFELNGTTMADAKLVHDLIVAGRAGGVNFWRNHAVQGGDCSTDVNRKTACVVFGRCG